MFRRYFRRFIANGVDDLNIYIFENLIQPIVTNETGIFIDDDGADNISVALDSSVILNTVEDTTQPGVNWALSIRPDIADTTVNSAATITSNSNEFTAQGISLITATGNLNLNNTGQITAINTGVGENDQGSGAIVALSFRRGNGT